MLSKSNLETVLGISGQQMVSSHVNKTFCLLKFIHDSCVGHKRAYLLEPDKHEYINSININTGQKKLASSAILPLTKYKNSITNFC